MDGVGLIHSGANASVPGYATLHLFNFSGSQPDNATAPAKACNACLVFITAVGSRPGHGSAHITQHLLVRGLADDVGKEIGDGGVLGRIALAMKTLGRDGHEALLGKAAADIFNVLVHAEDLVKNNDRGQTLFAFRLRKIAGKLIVRGPHLNHAMVKALGTGGDGLCLKSTCGGHRGCKAR